MYRLVPLETFEHDEHAVLAADTDGTVRFCNRATAILLGKDPETLVGKPCWKIAQLQSGSGAPFCSASCPIQQQARAGQLEPVHRAVLCRRGRPPVDLEVVTFLLPPSREERRGFIHFFRPICGSVPWPEKSPLATSSLGGAVGLLHRLTPREADVLRLLSDGLDTPTIAARLSVSYATARNHIENILRKLGVHRRVDAILALLHTRP